MATALGGDDLTLLDLSYAGCAVRGCDAYNVGDETYLTFTVGLSLSFIVPVRVMYSRTTGSRRARPARYVTGFAFVAARQPEIHRIVEILLEASNAPLSVH
jgi:hypothetical protein